jgi:hypothetical protein
MPRVRYFLYDAEFFVAGFPQNTEVLSESSMSNIWKQTPYNNDISIQNGYDDEYPAGSDVLTL